MSLFSNDMRVANTATPSFTHETNVGQYGWTGAESANYNQLIQYVDECRKIWLNLEEKILYVEGILVTVGNIDDQVKYVELMTNEVMKWRQEVLTSRDLVSSMYNQLVPLFEDFNPKYEDGVKKYTEVVKLHSEVGLNAAAAALSELAAAKSAQEAADVAEELRKGQVYRGTWNIEANNSFPAKPDTNSVWDIVLNESSIEFHFNGEIWYWGDRLLYLKDDDAFTQIEAGGSVTSVNGKKGAVTITYTDVHAAPEGFGLGGYGSSLSNKSANETNGSGFYSVFSATTDTPYNDGGPSGSQIMNMEWGAAGATQLFSAYTANRLHFRRKYQNTWQPWFELYHTGRKPTPSELGALNKAGDTVDGNLSLGSSARLVLNNTAVMGANNAPILRDHGNGNVTLSASVNPSGNAGVLYLGYNAGLTGTAGYNTAEVRIDSPMTFKGTPLVDANGKIPLDRVTSAVGTSGATMTGPLYWSDANKYINASGNNAYVAAKLGRVYIEGNSTPIARVAGVDYNMYHQGFKPTAADVGAVPLTGGTIDGSISIKGGSGVNPLNISAKPNTTGTSAMGVHGFDSTGATRQWGAGAYYENGTAQYSFMGFGTSPWSNGLKIYGSRSEFNHQLRVGGNITSNITSGGEMISLNYGTGSGGSVVGNESGVRDWYVGRANTAGDVALYSNKHSSGLVLRSDKVEFTKNPMYGNYQVYHANSKQPNLPNAGEFTSNYGYHQSGLSQFYTGGGTPSGMVPGGSVGVGIHILRNTTAGTSTSDQAVTLYTPNTGENSLFFKNNFGHADGWKNANGWSAVMMTKNLYGKDLNTLTDSAWHGEWFQDTTANATTSRNYPIQEAGRLTVAGGPYGAIQEYTSYSSARKFTRGKSGSASAWLPWREISAWGQLNNASLTAGYSNYGSGYGPAQFQRNGNQVIVSGMIRRDTTGTVNAFALPNGYKPPYRKIFTCACDVAPGFMRVDVNTDGYIILNLAVGTGVGWLSLDGITFRTEQ